MATTQGVSAEPSVEGEAESTPEPTPETEPEPETAGSPSATTAEILVPPILLALLILLGLLVLSLITQRYWWKRRVRKCREQSENASQQLSPKNSVGSLRNVVCNSGRSSASSCQSGSQSERFLSERDHRVVDEIRRFPNTPWALFCLSLPCTISLAFCPVTLLLQSPMVKLFWPRDLFPEPPKVNDVIACFLTPAGLVYAIAFGFAFQEALGKQALIINKVSAEMSALEHLRALTVNVKLSSFTVEHKRRLIELLKDHSVDWMEHIIGKADRGKKEPSSKDSDGKGMWEVLDLLQKISVTSEADPSGSCGVHQAMLERMMNHALHLQASGSDPVDQLNTRIHILQWAFLETLGYFSFFGILLLNADSYRLELCLCVLTVFSIAMFCYVLSDLDSPFHGVFRVDLSGLPAFLLRLRATHKSLDAQEYQNASYVECRDPAVVL